MEKYHYFDNKYAYKKYLRDIKKCKIGSGSEGKAYLTKDKRVVKVFEGPMDSRISEDKKDKIVMKQDYDLPTFLFPTELHIVDGLIVGYMEDYFPNNVLVFKAPYNGDINNIDIDNLLRAREQMIKDAIVLTDDKIAIRDLTFNLFFDNQKLGAIDTFSYFYNPYITPEKNIAIIDYAIMHELHFHDINFEPNYGLSVEDNLKRIRR